MDAGPLPKRPRFSVVVLAHNEAADDRLPLLLGTLKPFLEAGGDVLVADSASTDETVSVAESLGARVAQFGAVYRRHLTKKQLRRVQPLFGPLADGEKPVLSRDAGYFAFGPARDAAAAAARCDYVLHLDCGDRVLHMDLARIDAVVQPRLVVDLVHFLYARVAGRPEDDPEQEESHVSVRFYDRREYEYYGRAHEGVYRRAGRDLPEARVSMGPDVLKVRYHRRPDAHGKYVRNYCAPLALDVDEHPTQHRWYHYLGRELYYARRWRAALCIFERGLERATGYYVERCDSLCFAGECHENLGEPDAALACYARATAADGSRRNPWLRMGLTHQGKRNFLAARACAYAALSVPRPPVARVYEPVQNYTTLPHDIAYCAHAHLGETELGRPHWRKCLEFQPTNERYVHDAKFFPEKCAETFADPPADP